MRAEKCRARFSTARGLLRDESSLKHVQFVKSKGANLLACSCLVSLPGRHPKGFGESACTPGLTLPGILQILDLCTTDFTSISVVDQSFSDPVYWAPVDAEDKVCRGVMRRLLAADPSAHVAVVRIDLTSPNPKPFPPKYGVARILLHRPPAPLEEVFTTVCLDASGLQAVQEFADGALLFLA